MRSDRGSLLLLLCLVCASLCSADQDEFRNTTQIIRSRGFVAEEHSVETSDGYILTIFRIRNPNFATAGKPVLLMHPLVGESANFIINSELGFVNESVSEVGNNLGFELAKRPDYDVWLGNVRGNVNSMRHRTLKPADSQFWKFSIDEHSAYDLPAMVQYIQNVTARQKIDYVGHSQGSMIMFAQLSRQPEFGDKIDHFIALGPVANAAHVKTPFRYLLNSYGFRLYLTWSSGAFLPPYSILQPIARLFCPRTLTGSLCTNFLFLVCGYSDQIDKARLPVIVAHAPAGTSKQNMMHFLQIMSTGKFAMYDHGQRDNQYKYGRPQPPEYDVSKITHPKMSLLWSENDALADPDDVQSLRQKLTVKLADDYKVPIKQFNHLDFLWARDTGKYINTKVMEILQRKD